MTIGERMRRWGRTTNSNYEEEEKVELIRAVQMDEGKCTEIYFSPNHDRTNEFQTNS